MTIEELRDLTTDLCAKGFDQAKVVIVLGGCETNEKEFQPIVELVKTTTWCRHQKPYLEIRTGPPIP